MVKKILSDEYSFSSLAWKLWKESLNLPKTSKDIFAEIFYSAINNKKRKFRIKYLKKK